MTTEMLTEQGVRRRINTLRVFAEVFSEQAKNGDDLMMSSILTYISDCLTFIMDHLE